MKSFDSNNPGKRWVKSSRSMTNGNCVEVAGLSANRVGVRDSKNPQGYVLQFTLARWSAFVGRVRDGKFDQQ